MNEQAAQALINDWLGELKQRSYNDLTLMIGRTRTETRRGEDGKEYQLEAEVFWANKKGGDVLVIVSADDGGLRAFHPLSSSFLRGPDGYLAEEWPNGRFSD